MYVLGFEAEHFGRSHAGSEDQYSDISQRPRKPLADTLSPQDARVRAFDLETLLTFSLQPPDWHRCNPAELRS